MKADPFEIQVLTPMRKGALGVENLNKILQEYLNPPSEEKKEKLFAHATFREGDKVMQIRNNYQLEWEVRGRYGIAVEQGAGVFNGDMGLIRSINLFTEEFEVEFDERADGDVFRSAGWRSWSWPTRSRSTNPRAANIRP